MAKETMISIEAGVRDSNSPYSFNSRSMSLFPCFGTGNRRFQVFHTAFDRARGDGFRVSIRGSP